MSIIRLALLTLLALLLVSAAAIAAPTIKPVVTVSANLGSTSARSFRSSPRRRRAAAWC